MTSKRIMLIRHAEKPDLLGRIPGLDKRGLPHPGGLSIVGWQRAGALVHWFAAADETSDVQVSRPAAILAARDTAKSQRPRLTVDPLARALGVKIDSHHESTDDPAQLKEVLLALDGPVLVCWRHRALPALASVFAPVEPVPPEWPADRFDLVWVLDREEDGAWHFRSVPQRLLPGDEGLQGAGTQVALAPVPSVATRGRHEAEPHGPKRAYLKHAGGSPARARSHIFENKRSSSRT